MGYLRRIIRELIDISVIFTTLTMSLGNGFRLSCRREEKGWGRSWLRLAACRMQGIQSSTCIKEK
jgi:hypothetical protein